jgi:hypothetical protein
MLAVEDVHILEQDNRLRRLLRGVGLDAVGKGKSQ